jgi:tetratricopeptide (TPR) repeat protein
VILIPSFSNWRLVAAGVFFACGLLSKEAAIVFPALTVACLFYLRERRWQWRTYLATLPFWLMAVLYLILRKTVWNFDDSFHFYKEANVYTESIHVRCLTFLATLPKYLQVLFYPVDLHIDRHFPVFTSVMVTPVLAGAGLATLAFGIWSSAYWGKSIFAAWVVFWFFAVHGPHSGIFMPMNSLFLEHWLYLSSISGFLACGYLAARLLKSKMWHAVALGLALLVLLLGARTWNQNQVWATPIALYSHILKFNPTAARVHNNLAMAYAAESDIPKAIEHYERAISISDVYPESHHNLALAYFQVGRIDEGIGHLEKAVRINPDFFFSYEYLAHAYEIKGDRVKAAEYRRKFNEIRHKFIH